MTNVNVPLLRKVLEHVTEHPEEHRQDWWATRTECGTAYCIAGHAAVMSGHTVWWYDGEADESSLTTNGGSICAVAATELGISGRDALELFSGGNALADCWRIANRITGGEIEVPAQFQDGAQ